ncbi:MAG: Sec-independent protein translocase protein TatB [Steroidobacteraceae bacterium]
MFEVGFTEILLIFGIALLVLGPARLPKLAADVGRWAGRARAVVRQLRTQLEQEVHFDPLAEQPATAATAHTPPPFPQPAAPPAAQPATAAAADPAPATEPAPAAAAAADATDERKPAA